MPGRPHHERKGYGQGKLCSIQDSSGKIQLYIRRDDICPGEDKSLYDVIWKKLVDIGDIIGERIRVYHKNRVKHRCM